MTYPYHWETRFYSQNWHEWIPLGTSTQSAYRQSDLSSLSQVLYKT